MTPSDDEIENARSSFLQFIAKVFITQLAARSYRIGDINEYIDIVNEVREEVKVIVNDAWKERVEVVPEKWTKYIEDTCDKIALFLIKQKEGQ